MFNYDPISREQAEKERFSLLDDGDYSAVINSAMPKISSSNNQMIELELEVYDASGKPHPLKDYLVFSPKMMWKVINCADGCGLLKEYEDKKFHPSMLPGKNIRVRVKTQKGNEIPEEKLKGKPLGTKYPDKNVIEDYLVPDTVINCILTRSDDFQESSEIPF